MFEGLEEFAAGICLEQSNDLALRLAFRQLSVPIRLGGLVDSKSADDHDVRRPVQPAVPAGIDSGCLMGS